MVPLRKEGISKIHASERRMVAHRIKVGVKR